MSAATLIFTIMSLLAAFKSDVVPELFARSGSAAAVAAISVLLGVLLERFAAKPFFKSIGVPVKSKLVAAIVVLPCALAVFTISAGVWGMTSGFSEPGVELLKAILLSFVVAVTIIVVSFRKGFDDGYHQLGPEYDADGARELPCPRLVASETIGRRSSAPIRPGP